MEKLLKISCSEIRVIRIICNTCKTAMELPLERLEHGGSKCPGCGEELRRAGVDKSILELSNALRHLQRVKEIEIQFVVPLSE